MKLCRSLLIGTGRLVVGLVLLDAGIDALESPAVRERTAPSKSLDAVRGVADGVLRDIASVKQSLRP